MRPEPKYTGRPTRFWAHAKFISEKVGYGDRGTKRLRTYTPIQAIAALRDRALIPDNDLLADVLDYLNWRAQMLNEHVAGQFMDRAQAAVEFAKMRNRLPPTKSLPMNKQKGEKRHPAYLASMVAMTAESVFGPDGFVDDARKLSILTWEDPHATWAKCLTFSFYRRSFYVVGLWEVISLPND